MVDGVMYITSSNEVYALDARTGRRIWKYRDDQSKRQKRESRRCGIRRSRVLRHQRLSFGRAEPDYGSGTLQTKICRFRAAILRDSRAAGREGPCPCGSRRRRARNPRFVAAMSASTGEELWCFYTVPRKGEPGAETGGDLQHGLGRGGTWMNGTDDPEFDLVTGRPVIRGRHTTQASAAATTCIHARSWLWMSRRASQWHFQFTPGDYHDWDAQSIPVLIDGEYKGRKRKLLLHPNRDGFFYVLDRTNGEFLNATPFVDNLNWATGFDKKGRPIEVPNLLPSANGTRICPAVRGASNWMSPSFNPDTKLLYVPSLEQCDMYTTTTAKAETIIGFAGGGGEQIPKAPGKFSISAPLITRRASECGSTPCPVLRTCGQERCPQPEELFSSAMTTAISCQWTAIR